MATAAARHFIVDKAHPRVASRAPLSDPKDGPLLAVRLSVLTRKTLGGLWCDETGRALTPDGEVLEGLWAVGEAAGFGGGGVARPPRAGGHVPGRLPLHGPDDGPRAGGGAVNP